MRCLLSPRLGLLAKRHIFRGHDVRTEHTSAHEGTAALQQRYTDARATPHMTPTSMEVDSLTRVDLAQMLSKSCAIRTISPQVGFSVHPGQATNGMFFVPLALLCVVSHSYPASFVLRMSKAFPKCLLTAYAWEHTICTMCNVFKLSSRLSSCAYLWCTRVHRAAMFGHRTSDFTSVSLNIYHASQNHLPLTFSSAWANVRCSHFFKHC